MDRRHPSTSRAVVLAILCPLWGVALLAGCGGAEAELAEPTTATEGDGFEYGEGVDYEPGPPPPTSTPGADVTGPRADEECPLVGAWEGEVEDGRFAGETMRWSVDEEGTIVAAGGPTTVNQSWSLYENVLTVHDVSTTPPAVGCSPEESATYLLQFAEDCFSFTLEAQEDPCEGRRATLHGVRMERR